MQIHSPPSSQRLQRAQPVVTPCDQVEHDVDVRDGLLERPGGVVDRLVDPEIAEEVVLLLPGGADHVGASRLGDLHGEVTHPTGRRVDQNARALPHLRHVDQRLPGREPGERQSPGLLIAESVGGTRQLARRRGDVLRVASRQPREPGHAEDPVARREAGDVGVDLLHDAGDVPAQDERRLPDGLPVPAALTGFPVDRVDPGGGDTNKDLGRNGLGPLHISQLEDLWPAQGRHHNGLQRLTSTR